MITSISNDVNVLHRTALNKAIHKLRTDWSTTKTKKKIVVLVGTKNIIRNIFSVVFSKDIIILYFTGFGRLYTDFGVLGRLIFKTLIIMSGLRYNRHFIVENRCDHRIVAHLSRRPVTQTNGSGFNNSLYSTPQYNLSKPYGKVIGHMSRFGPSKCTDEVIKLITTLPSEYRIIIAGEDINGSKYTNKFCELAQTHTNVDMIGLIETPEQVSSFFQKIDVLLYPSIREGLPMTLLESVYHGVPFLTTNVPGCVHIAAQFGFPTCAPEDFGKQKNHLDIPSWGSYDPQWDAILAEFSAQNVQKQFEKLFDEIIENQQLGEN